MLPIIFQASWEGKLLIIIYFVFLMIQLLFLLTKNYFLKYSFGHQIFFILITIYFSIFYYKVYTIGIPNIDITYCEINYLYVSVLLTINSLVMIVYSLLKKIKNKKHV